MSPDPGAAVMVERVGTLGRIKLNRPRALNSLTLDMVKTIDAALDRFLAEPGVGAILVTGEGERGFCAGGDLRSIAETVEAGADASVFFRAEYALNARLAGFGKPVVAIMDGITLGGGVGLAAHGSHRVVTERSRVGMPEVKIGFVPDVGSSWLLSRAPGETGTYVALTGAHLGPADAIAVGLADVCVPAGQLPGLIGDLARLPVSVGSDGVSRSLEACAVDPGPGLLAPHLAIIDRAFAADSVEAIMSRLESEATDFALATREALAAASPTSLKAALRLLRLAAGAPSVEACLMLEFRAVMALLERPDFRAGVEAALKTKTRPIWSPDALSDVADSDVDAWFRSSTNELLLP